MTDASKKDGYAAKIARYKAALAEFDAKADELKLAERVLVEQSHQDGAQRRFLLARYDAVLEAKDEAEIAAYMAGMEALRVRCIERKAALEAVRAEYKALERERPRRPWRELLGF